MGPDTVPCQPSWQSRVTNVLQTLAPLGSAFKMNKELKVVLKTEFIRNDLVSETSTKSLVDKIYNLLYRRA
jgi:hypothetical protein